MGYLTSGQSLFQSLRMIGEAGVHASYDRLCPSDALGIPRRTGTAVRERYAKEVALCLTGQDAPMWPV